MKFDIPALRYLFKTINKVANIYLNRRFDEQNSSNKYNELSIKTVKCFAMSSLTSIQMGSPPLVKAAATVLKELCYSNREELQAGFITAGWDKKKGPQV